MKGGNVNSTLTIDCEKLPNTSGRTTRYPMKYEGEIIFIRDMIASSGDPVKDLNQEFQDNINYKSFLPPLSSHMYHNITTNH